MNILKSVEITRVLSGNRVTIPVEMRKDVGLEVGQYVAIIRDSECPSRLEIEPIKVGLNPMDGSIRVVTGNESL